MTTKVYNRMIVGATANILDYGAVGNGIVDDTNAFQLALNSGLPVYIPYEYDISVRPTAIDFTSAIGIVGSGTLRFKEHTIKAINNNFFIDGLTIINENFFGVQFTGGEDIRIENCEFINSATTSSGQNYFINIYLSTCPRAVIRNIKATKGAVFLRDCRNTRMSDCYIDIENAGAGTGEDGTDGIKLTSGTTGTFNNIIILDASRDGIDAFTAGRDLTITNIIIARPTTHGIEFKINAQTDYNDAPHKIAVNNFLIVGGVGKKGGQITAGITIKIDNDSNAYRADDIHISNGVIADLGEDALSGTVCGVYADSARNLHLSNVTIRNIQNTTVAGQTSNGYGMRLARCKGVSISGGNVHGEYRGLYASSSEDINISSCVIGQDKTTNATSAIGFLMPNTATDATIIGCSIYGSTRAISTEGSTLTGVAFANCLVNGNTYFDNSSRLSITGTKFTASSGDNVFIRTGSNKDIMITGCSFYGGARGFYASTASGINVNNCYFESISSTCAQFNSCKGVIMGCSFRAGATNNIRETGTAGMIKPVGTNWEE